MYTKEWLIALVYLLIVEAITSEVNSNADDSDEISSTKQKQYSTNPEVTTAVLSKPSGKPIEPIYQPD